MEIWHHIEELVDDDCGFTSDGRVMVAENEADLANCRARVGDLNLRGFHREELIDAKVREIVRRSGGLPRRRDFAWRPGGYSVARRRPSSSRRRASVSTSARACASPGWSVMGPIGASSPMRVISYRRASSTPTSAQGRIAADLDEAVRSRPSRRCCPSRHRCRPSSSLW